MVNSVSTVSDRITFFSVSKKGIILDILVMSKKIIAKCKPTTSSKHDVKQFILT